MKRLISVFLMLAMIFALAACNNETVATGSENVVMITASAGIMDGGLNEMAWKGLEEAAAQSGNSDKISYMEGVSDGAAAIKEAIDGGAKAIIAADALLAKAMLDAAPTNPDVLFVINDYRAGSVPANVSCHNYEVKEASFIMGCLAARTSQTGIIGFIGAEDSSVSADYKDYYKKGAEYINPEITLLTADANNDSKAGYDAASGLYNQGADVVFAAAYSANAGALDCANELGKWLIGTDIDEAKAQSDQLLSSIIREVTVSIKDVSAAIFADENIGGQVITAAFKSGTVDISTNNGNIDEEIYAEMLDLRSKIISGDFDIDNPKQPESDTQIAADAPIVILHTNDTHGRVDTNMSFASIKTLREKYEAEGAIVITMDAGDTLHGLPIATFDKGETIAELFNMAGYDVMVPGNHDFNYGADRLVELSEMLNFPMISANVISAKDKNLLFKPYTIIEKGGKKIGVFGITTPEAGKAQKDKIAVTDTIAATQTVVSMLKKQNVDYIVGLMHVGLESIHGTTSEEIAQSVDGIDIIIDGHSHTLLEEGLLVGNTLIASTGEHLNNIGVVTISADGAKEAALVNAEQWSETDEDMEKVLTAKSAELDAALSVVVGHTPVTLDGEREQVRCFETNFGQLSADAIRAGTGSQVVLIAGGGIRASIPAGDISMNDILTVFPFYNYIVEKKVSGQSIIDSLELGMSLYPESNATFPHVSGMTFVVNVAAEEGKRILSVKINGEEIDPEAMYTLATNDYIASGGDYPYFADFETTQTFGNLEDMVLDYIKVTDMSQYETAEERITYVEADDLRDAA